MSVGSSMERAGQSAEWYIDARRRTTTRSLRIFYGHSIRQLACRRVRVRQRGVRSDDADRPPREARPPYPLLEAVFFGTAVRV
jgi:hypothetical protein